MDIKNKTVLVLGGWGLVGNSVIRKMLPEKPGRIIVTSLKKEEAQEAVAHLKKEFPGYPANFFTPWWGNVFLREEHKELNRVEILMDPEKRKTMMEDTMEELTPEILEASSLYKLITKYKPDVIIDCINTATGIAYQDIYTTYKTLKNRLKNKPGAEELTAEIEKLFCTMYLPQLIRHIQIFYNAMAKAKTQIYFKVGTSGTGGMGLNIPYTHSEEKPSRVLLSKSAVAGAHTLLLFLMARTPDTAITKEIKPAAAIAWKRIAFGPVRKRGKEIELLDIEPEMAQVLGSEYRFALKNKIPSSGKPLQSVFIDTGENGIFSRGEFEAISAQKQMEFVTPEEIADNIIFEIKGGNTGHDVINALDNATLNPSYRAGYMQHFAVNKMAELEKLSGIDSVAFEMLGPPRLSKLLYEIYLISKIAGSMKSAAVYDAKKLSDGCFKLISEDKELTSRIVSIGIPVLFPDGKTLLRGNDVKIPVQTGNEFLPMDQKTIDIWANDGWVDLRKENMSQWKKRLKALMEEADAISDDDSSSLHVRTKSYWNNYETIDPGRVVSWIFIHEEKGKRIKG
ncbi:MAG: short-chain dehydrogenase [Ignavibacteriaceae bacterium]|nr:short-chain dehydrogenase [Ignavibacteriaceae bacterium]